MIRKLRMRMTLLVIGVLVIVSAGIVLAINEFNNRSIETRAAAALEVLTENSGRRPTLPLRRSADGTEEEPTERFETPPPKPDGEDRTPPGEYENSLGWQNDGRMAGGRGMMTRGGRALTGQEVASLSNYYTITLDSEGKITSWESDREDLYSQKDLQAFADQVLAGGKSEGRIDTQFYRLKDGDDGRMLIVLDARLEWEAGRQVLRTTALVAGIACLVLSLGAWLLIRRMIHPVEEAFRKQQQFIWDASHELKTPLAVISANADVLENEIGKNEYLGYIRSEVRRTDSLVKNLLTLARMDRGTDQREMKEMDLSEAVTAVLLPFESTVFEAGKNMETEITEHVRCVGNEEMLQQLTVILLSNALKYSDEHGTIRVSLSRRSHGCELRVENTGEGIAPCDLDRIFDRFYRTDASRNSETGGEGLGLAIARSIVEIHRGRIHAESEPGKGAAFIVNLP